MAEVGTGKGRGGASRRGLLDALMHRRSVARWTRAARRGAAASLATLRVQTDEAHALRHQLDELLHIAENRLALPRIGSTAFPQPAGTDWAWRPQLWRGPLPRQGHASVETRAKIGDEVTVFHDCDITELTLRQLRNTSEADLAPFALRMDVFRFDGSFLSLVLDLPDAAVRGLQKRHLIRLDATIEAEAPLEIFARLNIRHGPNSEQIVRELPLDGSELSVEFDLAYTKLNEKRVEALWLDLIFEEPQMNQVTIRDLTFCRHPRASI